jgi:hypothetical protein
MRWCIETGLEILLALFIMFCLMVVWEMTTFERSMAWM